jgi:RND family efflux transporter MFP subunit
MILARRTVRPLFLLPIFFATAWLTPGCARVAAPEEEEHPAPVEAVAPRALSLGGWTEVLGTTQPLPQHAARITAAVEGRVQTLLQDAKGKPLAEGQPVQAGDVIVQLDATVARANRDKVEAGQRDLDEQKKQADLAVQLADIEVKRLEELARTTSIGGPGTLVSRIELDKARLAQKDAESKQRAAAGRLDTAVKELKALDEQLALYTLRAPIAGRLGMMQVVQGQTLAVGSPVADVVDLETIDVLCFVPPRSAALLALDQPARLAPEKEAGEETSAPTGKVVFLAVQAQSDTGNLPVKVRFPNKDSRLRTNTLVRLQVQTSPEKERITVPDTALMEDQDPPTVLIVEHVEVKKNKEGKDEKLGKARRLQAKVGVRDRRWHVVEILGLEDPEKKEAVPLQDALIIVKGGQGLRDDDTVKLEEEEEGPEK